MSTRSVYEWHWNRAGRKLDRKRGLLSRAKNPKAIAILKKEIAGLKKENERCKARYLNSFKSNESTSV